MKKVLLGLVIAVMMTGSLKAEIRPIDSKRSLKSDRLIYTTCVDGYLFVDISRRTFGKSTYEAPSITQHFSIQNGKSLPTQC